MTPEIMYVISLGIIIGYSLFVINRLKKQLKEKEDRIASVLADKTSMAIQIEMDSETINALRLRISRCNVCRMDQALLVADIREQNKTKKEVKK